MDIALEFIDSMRSKFLSEKKWLLQALEQLSDEDMTCSPTPESNSIANLVAHIRGGVHARIEVLLYDIPDTRDRDREFERGLQMTKAQAVELIREAFDLLLLYLDRLRANPELLMSRPFLNRPTLTYSQTSNEATAMNLMIAMLREVQNHTGQIIYAAKIRKGQLVWRYD